MKGPSIIVKNLKAKLQGHTVLDDISFTLNNQQHLAIVGPSGSGKTTLAKALIGQIFYSGTVSYKTETTERATILLVDQRAEFKNLSNITDFYYQQRFNSTESEDACTVEVVMESEAAKLSGDNEEKAQMINLWLSRFHMNHRRTTPLIQLSNGEHKRLQLMKALLQKPNVLILDQPFIGLDVQSRKELHEIINHLSSQCTIIVIAGGKELPSCITHIAQLENGKLKQYCEKEYFSDDQAETDNFFPLDKLPLNEETIPFKTAVSLVDVSVRYGEKTILNNINWKVSRGEKWLVKGPNGAGKSTLLTLLTGDNPQAYANEVYLFDKRRGTGESIWDIKKKVGFVSPELHWHFDKGITVAQTIASGLFDTMGLYRQISEEQVELVAAWMDFFNLTDKADTTLFSLSSGEQRLVMLARALVKNPPMLILDEPCQGLDTKQMTFFVNLIDELCTRLNKTLIYVSHYDSEVPSCIDKKLELNSGNAVISNIVAKQIVVA